MYHAVAGIEDKLRFKQGQWDNLKNPGDNFEVSWCNQTGPHRQIIANGTFRLMLHRLILGVVDMIYYSLISGDYKLRGGQYVYTDHRLPILNQMLQMQL